MLNVLNGWTAWLQSWLSADAGLWGLLLSAFLSATVLPGSSELVMVALVSVYPQLFWPAFAAALAGNVVGSMLSYGIGWAGQQGYERFQGVQARLQPGHGRMQRLQLQLRLKGPPLLLFAFLPLVGDALVLAAGWFGLPFWPSMLWTALGKAARYAVVLAGLEGLRALA